jgi:hypothetical protein
MTFFSAAGEYTCDKINEDFGTITLGPNIGRKEGINYDNGTIMLEPNIGRKEVINQSEILMLTLEEVCSNNTNENLCYGIQRSTIDLKYLSKKLGHLINNEDARTARQNKRPTYKEFKLFEKKEDEGMDSNYNSYITKCTFDITTNDQNTGNYDGTKIRLFLTNGNEEHEIIPDDYCVAQDYVKLNKSREQKFKGNKIFKIPINIKMKTTVTLRLYNLYPGHIAQVKEINVLDLHIWRNIKVNKLIN